MGGRAVRRHRHTTRTGAARHDDEDGPDARAAGWGTTPRGARDAAHRRGGADFPPKAYVFGNEVGERIGSVKTAWVASCRRAGITGLRFHDLRYSFSCSLLESGAGLHDVRDFLGHTDITTTSKYLAATPVRLRAALDRMEGTGVETPAEAGAPPVLVPTSASVN